ncbi:MAG: hypothetical protein NVS3B21_16920 [Acidimicrobiales bacterium]
MKPDTITELEPILAAAQARNAGQRPWIDTPGKVTYLPDLDTLRELLTVPMTAQATTQSGRLAKAFDAWLAYELRRAGFGADEVWPRLTQPRVISTEMARMERAIAALGAQFDKMDAKLTAAGTKPPVGWAGIRGAISKTAGAVPATGASNILGRFYVKQVDVAVSSWDRGPDVLISGKTMFSSYGKNTKNRYEETLGEAVNLRDRHPLAAMGYAFVVNVDIYKEKGAYARLQDLLRRTRKPDGPYDGTLLLVADWDAATGALVIQDSAEAPDLGAAPFFEDLLNAVMTNTPVGIHQHVRELRDGKAPTGGAPNPVADANSVAKAKEKAADLPDDTAAHDEDADLTEPEPASETDTLEFE